MEPSKFCGECVSVSLASVLPSTMRPVSQLWRSLLLLQEDMAAMWLPQMSVPLQVAQAAYGEGLLCAERCSLGTDATGIRCYSCSFTQCELVI